MAVHARRTRSGKRQSRCPPAASLRHDGAASPHFQDRHGLFLATEILLFGGLFVGFALMQARYPREFVEAHTHLVRWQGALNTIVLLVSSFTMVMAVDSAKKNKPAVTQRYLALTIACAFIFLVVKYFEYSHQFEEGCLPGAYYHAIGDEFPGSRGYTTFFSFYFMMTGCTESIL